MSGGALGFFLHPYKEDLFWGLNLSRNYLLSDGLSKNHPVGDIQPDSAQHDSFSAAASHGID